MHPTRGFHRGGGGAYNRMYFLFIGRWTYNWGEGVGAYPRHSWQFMMVLLLFTRSPGHRAPL